MLSLPGRVDGVGAVLDQEQPFVPADLGDSVDLRTLTPHVGDNHGLGQRGDVGQKGIGIHVVGVPSHIGEARYRVEVYGGQPAEVHDRIADHLESGTGPGHADSLDQTRHGAVLGHGLLCPYLLGKGLFEAPGHALLAEIVAQGISPHHLSQIGQLGFPELAQLPCAELGIDQMVGSFSDFFLLAHLYIAP
ncbi:hypothetical protein ES708_30821 [subsurface metagenome]